MPNSDCRPPTPDANGACTAPSFIVAAALFIAASLAAPEPVASATASCGMVVADRLVLDRDLRCPGPALVVRNPRTVVQLNGHVLESSRPCEQAAGSIGIVIEPTAARATILGPGIVRGFATGIAINDAPQTQLRDVRVTESCALGVAVHGGNGGRARDLVLDRNGNGSETAAAMRIEQTARFALLDSDVFLNDAGSNGAVLDLRRSQSCRIGGNRIVANHGTGIRLDVDSQANELERNLVVGQRPNDVVDQGSDNLFTLNGFEHGDGVDPPPLWPLLGLPASPAPGVAGCGTMHDSVRAHATVTITCPQDPGLRAVRNSVVAYRLLNLFNTSQLFGATCSPGVVHPADGSTGGGVTCTNPDSIWTAILEVTCCFN